MIKTLRITSITAAVLAVVFFVFPAVFGVRNDEEIEGFLNSAGVIEKFNKAKGEKSSTSSESRSSPLVKQAKAFALYLNPPAKPKRRAPSRAKPSVIPRPNKVSVKFNLIGTSFYALHPELSLALIDEPGKGLRWVRQSSELGRLIIEQIKDGLVIVKDGQRTFEIAVPERPGKRSLLKKAPADETAAKAAPSTSDEEIAAFEEFVRELETMEAGKSDKSDSKQHDEEVVASMDKFISQLQAMRISAGEAKILDRLGKDLNDVEQDPNRAGSGKVENSKSSQEPNSTNKK
jgi:hypothetical protein